MFLLQQQQRQCCSGHHTQQLSNPISSCGCVFITAAAWAGSLCCVRQTPLLWGEEGGDACLCVCTLWHAPVAWGKHYASYAAALVVIRAERAEGEEGTRVGAARRIWCEWNVWVTLLQLNFTPRRKEMMKNERHQASKVNCFIRFCKKKKEKNLWLLHLLNTK